MRNIPLGPLWSDVSDPELEALLRPAAAFDHPEDVVRRKTRDPIVLRT
jgi:hypothetical protein